MTVAVTGPGSMIAKRIMKRIGERCSLLSIGRSDGSDVLMDLRYPTPPPAQHYEADVVIHCAASFCGDEIEDHIENELVNSVGCLRVAQVAAAMKCRHLIYVSTISSLAENVRVSSYGLSKRHGEENLKLACGTMGIDLTILWVTQVYDDVGEARKHQPMLYRIVDCARKGQAFQFFGNQDPLRNLIFVEDVVSVIERVMDRGLTGSYAIVHPESRRISEIVAIAFDAFGRTAEIVRRPDQSDIPTVWYPSASPVFDLVDYRAQTDLPTGIALIRDRMA